MAEPRRSGLLGETVAKVKARRRKLRSIERAERKAAHVPKRADAKTKRAPRHRR